MQEITNILYSESMAVFFSLLLFYLKYSIVAQLKEKLYIVRFFKFFVPVMNRMDGKAELENFSPKSKNSQFKIYKKPQKTNNNKKKQFDDF